MLYADDTSIMSKTIEDIQKALYVFADYCNESKLTVNTEKTIVFVFGKRKCKQKYRNSWVVYKSRRGFQLQRQFQYCREASNRSNPKSSFCSLDEIKKHSTANGFTVAVI